MQMQKPPPLPRAASPEKQTSWWQKNWKWFVPVGCLGLLAVFIGFAALIVIGLQKWYALRHEMNVSLVADNVLFYIALACMIIGSQLFIGGFLGELVSRSSADRNKYQIEEEF